MADLSKKDIETIQKEIASKREELRAFRFGEAGSRSRNVRLGRTLRKEIAQLMTELSTRRIANNTKTA